MLKASFVIPTKNSGRFIEQCLSSLMPYYEQGYVEDIVIVDGLSTDDTLEKASKFPVKIISDDSGFPSVSWEKGWRNATGELIVFLDSDAYLGDGFFPKLFDFFQNDEVGIGGCEAVPVAIGGGLSLAEKQWSMYGEAVRFSPRGLLRRLVRKTLPASVRSPLPAGPCWIARRSAIEAVDGYRGFLGRVAPDRALPYRIVERGWEAQWWSGAPVYHYTRTAFKSQMRRCAHQGREAAFLLRDLKWSLFRQVMAMAVELGAPVVGLMGAVRFRNPWVFVFSLSRYAALAGYLAGLMSRSEDRIT